KSQPITKVTSKDVRLLHKTNEDPINKIYELTIRAENQTDKTLPAFSAEYYLTFDNGKKELVYTANFKPITGKNSEDIKVNIYPFFEERGLQITDRKSFELLLKQ
ncbi:MAG: hypothetical protein WBO70_01040, partial [Erysipelotrichaceae bacterium]